jgi:hypothetical protein
VTRAARWVAVVALAAAVAVALFRYLRAGNPLSLLVQVALPVLAAGILKGAALKFLGAPRPYLSAIVANTVSEVIGLGFSLERFGVPWGALGVSVLSSTGIEWVVLWLFSAASPVVCLARAFYINLLSHAALAGVVVFNASPWLGAGLVLAAFLLLILPIFLVPRGLAPEHIIQGRQGGSS